MVGCCGRIGNTKKPPFVKRFRWGIQVTHSAFFGTFLTTVPAIETLFGGSGYWATVGAISMIDATLGGSLKKGAERGLATFLGGFSGYAFFILVTWNEAITHYVIGKILVLFLLMTMPLLWGYIRYLTPLRPWFASYGLFTACLVTITAYLKGRPFRTALIRTLSIFSGAVIGTAVATLVFPLSARDEVIQRLCTLLQCTADILEPVLELEAGVVVQNSRTLSIMKPTRKLLEDIAIQKRELKKLHEAAHLYHQQKQEEKKKREHQEVPVTISKDPLSPSSSTSSNDSLAEADSQYDTKVKEPKPVVSTTDAVHSLEPTTDNEVSSVGRQQSGLTLISQCSSYFVELENELDNIRFEMMSEATDEYAKALLQEEERRQMRWAAIFASFTKCQSLFKNHATLLFDAKQECVYQTGKTVFPAKKHAKAIYHVQLLFHYVASLYFSLDQQIEQFARVRHDSLHRLRTASRSTTVRPPPPSVQPRTQLPPNLSPLKKSKQPQTKTGTAQPPANFAAISLYLCPPLSNIPLRQNPPDTDQIPLQGNGQSRSPEDERISRMYASLNAAFSWTEIYGNFMSKCVINIKEALRTLANSLMGHQKNTEKKTGAERIKEVLKYIDIAAEHLKTLTTLRREQRLIYSKIFTIAMVADKTGTWDARSNYSIEWGALTGLKPSVLREMTEAEHNAFWEMYWKGRDRLSIAIETLKLLMNQLYKLCRVIQSIFEFEQDQQ